MRLFKPCILIVVFLSIPLPGPKCLTSKQMRPVLHADGPIPMPPIPPGLFALPTAGATLQG